MEHYGDNPFEPINLLVVVRQAPRLVVPAADTPRGVLRVSDGRARRRLAFGSVLSSHMLLFEARSPAHHQQQNQHLDSGSISIRPPPSSPHWLAKSLERVLVPYYPLAGRLRLSPDHARLQLLCHAQGAVYVDAKANVSLAELRRLDRAFWSDLQYDFAPQAASEIPPLVIQVTSLTCGGFAISIRVLQALCDAAGILHFLHAWSELTRADRVGAPALATPIWGGIIPPRPQASLGPHKLHYPSLEPMRFDADGGADWKPHPEKEEAEAGEEEEEEAHPVPLPVAPPRSGPLLGLASISVPIDELVNLKDTIRVRCNKFEALAGLFWREHVRALGLPRSAPVELFFPAPVPHDSHLAFYGQHAFNCRASWRAGELLDADLSAAVQLVHDAKLRLDDESFAGCAREFGRLHRRSPAPPPNVLVFTLLWDGVSEIDFGLAAHAPDAVRLPSPINAITITGGLDDTIELVMTNVPESIVAGVRRHLLHPAAADAAVATHDHRNSSKL